MKFCINVVKGSIQRPTLTLILVFISCGLLSTGASILKTNQDTRYLFRSKLYEEKVYCAQDSIILLFNDDQGSLYSTANMTALRSLVTDLNENGSFEGTVSIFNLRSQIRVGRYIRPLIGSDLSPEEVEQALSNHPLSAGHLVSTDHKWLRVIVTPEQQSRTIDEWSELKLDLESVIEKNIGETTLSSAITGLPVLRCEIVEGLQKSLLVYIVFGILVGLVFCFVIFSSIWDALAVLIGPAVSMFVSLGIMGLLGHSLDPLNVVVAPLVLTISLTDAIHIRLLINQYGHSLEKRQAIKKSVEEVGPACVLTTLTTFFGFGSLLVSDLTAIQNLGLLCALSVAAALVAVLFVVPAISMFIPLGRHNRKMLIPNAVGNFLANVLPKFSYGISGLVLLAMPLLAWASNSLEPNISLSEALPKNSKAAGALVTSDEVFGGTIPMRIDVAWDKGSRLSPERLFQVLIGIEEYVEQDRNLGSCVSYVDLLKSLPEIEQPYWQRGGALKYIPEEHKREFFVSSKEKNAVFITCWVPDRGSEILNPSLERLETWLQQLDTSEEQLQITLKDDSLLAIRESDRLILGLLKSLALATILCVFTIAIGFRSAKLAVLSIVPNLFPLLGVAGAMSLLGFPLQLTSVTALTIALGIAFDDTIHFARRFELSGSFENSQAAVHDTVSHLFKPILMTTLILCSGLGVVLFSDLAVLSTFAFLFITCLILAVIGDLVFFPALILAFSRR